MIHCLMSYRNGSSLFLRMLGPPYKHTITQYRGHGLIALATEDDLLAGYLSSPTTKPIIPIHVGWYRFSDDIPDIWMAKKLSTNRQYISLVREGKNQIASWMKHRENNKESQVSFSKMCLGYKQRANHALYLQQNYNALIIKAEDLFVDPVETMQKVFQYMGLVYDVQYGKQCFCKENTQHSSWKTFDSVNDRSSFLTKEQIETFNKICGSTVTALGY